MTRCGAVVAALVLASCAGRTKAPASGEEAFFAPRFADATPAAPAPTADGNAFEVELSFERADGNRIAAPRFVVWPGQAASVAMTSPVLFIEGFDLAPTQDGVDADPIVGRIEEGMQFDASAVRVADGGLQLGFRARLSRVRHPIPTEERHLQGVAHPVTVQLPQIEQTEIAGMRWIAPGVQGLLARVPSPDCSGPMLVLARVRPVFVDAPQPAVEERAELAALHRPMSGHTVHLRVTAVEVARDFEPGTVLDETATPDVMKASGGRVLRDFELFTCLDSRVRLAGLRGPPDADAKSSGLVATVTDDGLLHVTWNGRTAAVKPNPGRRFVAIARVEGGGTAGALVSVDSD